MSNQFDKEENQNDIVESAEIALKAACLYKCDAQAVYNLLANLMMFCHKKNYNFEECLNKASYHFNCEK